MSTENQAQENKMGVMPENRLLLTMAIPIVISMLVQALYNVVDSVFVVMQRYNRPRFLRVLEKERGRHG